jgi:tRNA (cmo5U34)-methyltransferase
MEYLIRKIKEDEYHLLKEFTYQAVFLRDENIVVPRTVLDDPKLKVFYEDFGKPDDECLVVEVDNKVIGAVWTRILSGEVKGFGNIDQFTPEFGISLFKEYRNKGLGTKLMERMLDLLKKKGYIRASLAVQKDNYAVNMYQKVGFSIVKELKEEYLMVCDLQNTLVEMSDFFNNRAPIYEEKHLEHIGGMESKQILASFFPTHAKTMIDLGIGTGLELEAIFQRFPEIEVTGLDLAEDMLKLLVKKYPNRKIHLHRESYLDYDFGNCLYDVALSAMTLHHYNHQTKTDLYRRLHNSLKSNGVYIECDFMLSEHEYENPQEMEDFFFSEFERLKKEQGVTDNREYHYDTPCTVSNQKKMLLEAGFTNVKEVWHKKNVVILVADK